MYIYVYLMKFIYIYTYKLYKLYFLKFDNDKRADCSELASLLSGGVKHVDLNSRGG